MGQLAQDTFQRADENPLSGGGNWLTASTATPLQIVSNVAECSAIAAGGCTQYWSATFPNDQYAQVTLAALGNESSVDVAASCRIQAIGINYYNAGIVTNTSLPTGIGQANNWLFIEKLVAAGETNLAAVIGTPTVGDVYLLTVHDSTLVLRQNGNIVLIGGDNTFASGQPGIHTKATTVLANGQASAWAAGSPTLNFAAFNDTFIRANGALGANWLGMNSQSTLAISSNVVVAGGAGHNLAASIGTDYYRDQTASVQINVNSTTSFTGLALRISGNGALGYPFTGAGLSFYSCFYNNGKIFVQKITGAFTNTNGTTANLGNVTVGMVNGDTLGFSAVGSTLIVTKNGATVLTLSDSGLAGGHPGPYVFGTGGGSVFNFQSSSIGAPASAYSVPDCRITPNLSRLLQGTLIYDVQTSSNSTVPGVDSRAAGAPVDSRVAPNIPQNSRTPGTFGPGE